MPKARKTGTVGSHYTTVVLPPCKVCAAEATGYHFGVITCEACKAFYRRSLLRNRPAKCKNNGQCYNTTNKINTCSACRYKKCCDLGMSTEGIRRGRFSLPLRTTTIIEANSLEAKEENETTNIIKDTTCDVKDICLWNQDSPPYMTDTLCRDDFNLMHIDSDLGLVRQSEMICLTEAVVSSQDMVYPSLRNYFTSSVLDLHKKISEEFTLKGEIYETVFGRSEDSISTEEHQRIFADTGEDIDNRLSQLNMYGEAMEESISKYISFCELLPGFNTLQQNDQSVLIKAAHLEFWFYGSHMLFNKKLGVAMCFDGSQNGTKEHMTKFFDEEWIDLNFDFADSLSKLHLTFEEIALLRAIALTSADRCPLEDSSKSYSLQERFFECLRFSISKTSKCPTKRLCKIINRLMYCRSLQQINVQVNQKFLNDWGFLVNDYPLWKGMLSYTD
ncbi:Estrogen receptor [Mactra antiquata]